MKRLGVYIILGIVFDHFSVVVPILFCLILQLKLMPSLQPFYDVLGPPTVIAKIEQKKCKGGKQACQDSQRKQHSCKSKETILRNPSTS